MKSIIVLLSSYNGEKYIGCQVDSILGQELEDCSLTLLIRDDGSTDSTKKILDDYEKNNSNVVVLRGSNVGYISSFFELLRMAKAYDCDYIALSDQDDRWDSDKLQTGINIIGDIKTPFLYESTVRITDEDLNFKKIDQINTRPITFYNSAIQTFSAGHTYVFNKALLNEIKDDLDCRRVFAHDAFIHNVAIIKGQVFFDRTPHNDYRQHDYNLVGAAQKKGPFEWVKIRIKRIKKGESKAYAKQIYYYLEYFNDSLQIEYKKELLRFFNKQKNFFTRLGYILTTKFYRQTKFETFSFKILYLFGGYNFNKVKK